MTHRPLSHRTWLFPLCLLSVATALATADDKPTDSKPADTIRVAPELFRVVVELDGVFEAEQMTEIILLPQQWSTFTVEEVAEQGSRVKEGDLLIKFDARKIDDELRAAEFQAELGRLSLLQNHSELQSLELSVPLDLRAAREALDRARSDLAYHEKYWERLNRESADQSLKSSEYSLENAREELNQLEKMYKADELTEETEEIILKRARRAVEFAEFTLTRSQAQHEQTVNVSLPQQGRQVVEAVIRQEIALSRAEATLPLSLEQKRIERQKLEQTQRQLVEKLEQLRADRKWMEVHSPVAGLVYYGYCERGRWTVGSTLTRQLRKGGAATTNSVLMTIVTPERLVFRLDIPEKSLHQVTPNLPGSITPSGYPSLRLTGSLVDINPIPVKEGLFDGELKIESANDPHAKTLVRPGMTGKVKFVAYEAPEAISVPTSALQTDPADDSLKFVYVDEAGAPVRRNVVTGHSQGDRTEIKEGLNAGDLVYLKKP